MTRPQVASRSEVARGLRASGCATDVRESCPTKGWAATQVNFLRKASLNPSAWSASLWTFGCAYTQKGDAPYCHFLQTPLGDVILPGLKGKIAKMTLLRTGEEVPCIDQWGFELLKKDDQRIRPKGIVPGDVVKIVLSKE